MPAPNDIMRFYNKQKYGKTPFPVKRKSCHRTVIVDRHNRMAIALYYGDM